jgi:hypothetical protein
MTNSLFDRLNLITFVRGTVFEFIDYYLTSKINFYANYMENDKELYLRNRNCCDRRFSWMQ